MGMKAESWTLYAVGVCLVLIRMGSRLLTLGSPLKLQCDDWVMILVLMPFTATVVCANQAFATDQLDIDTVRGLKIRFALEELQITTNWLIKACLLVLYQRIFPTSTNKRKRRYFTYTSACCLVAYLLIQLLLPVWCRPFSGYWKPGAQCTAYRNHAITTMALETLTTLLVLILPIPFIPTPRKYLLFTLLFLGIAALVTGVFGRYYILSDPSSPVYLPWYMAETSSLIAYANIPFLTSLFNPANSARFRHVSNTSLSSWPRSYKDTPPVRAQRQRLDSIVSNMAPLDTDDSRNDASMSVPAPPMPVRSLSLSDPPPELEVYWSAMRQRAGTWFVIDAEELK
ncbi:hypothetical protein P280DRAFT_439921 [Massarina eburnea CBS 473.64]|uniref:Rhodopsin domain-containing protein n=1 Tax=Massarina eburnea CBS 473.64 TaxID=1395130 RepID=A0A6A6SGJ6_9PLEO|nr:hypothetical protein P280DRAFT_439921 [Massarina eburnea CBS 473.64]